MHALFLMGHLSLLIPKTSSKYPMTYQMSVAVARLAAESDRKEPELAFPPPHLVQPHGILEAAQGHVATV